MISIGYHKQCAVVLIALASCTHKGKSFEDVDLSFSDVKEPARIAQEAKPETENLIASTASTAPTTAVDQELDDYLNGLGSKPSPEVAAVPTEKKSETLAQLDSLFAAPPPGEPVPAQPATHLEENALPLQGPAPEVLQLAVPVIADPAIVSPEASKPAPGPRAAGKLPKHVVHRRGQALNRFYFLRKGDTPESTSRLLYGEAGHELELVRWNGEEPSWKPGKLLLFVSAAQPEDPEFLSFFDEQGIRAETYVLKKGEKLSAVAKHKYGHRGSWKEIALLNRIQSPKSLKEGTEIKLYPRDLQAFKIREVAEAAFSKDSASLHVAPAGAVAAKETVSLASSPITLPSPTKEGRVSELSRSKASKAAGIHPPEPEYFSYSLWAFILSSSLTLILIWLYRKSKEEAEFID